MEEIRLMTVRELRSLSHGAFPLPERFGVIIKSWTALRRLPGPFDASGECQSID